MTLTKGYSLFQIRKKPTFREMPLKRFPFVIIYELRSDKIIVFSVFNTHQNPDKKFK